jgi:hypothetical protein
LDEVDESAAGSLNLGKGARKGALSVSVATP